MYYGKGNLTSTHYAQTIKGISNNKRRKMSKAKTHHLVLITKTHRDDILESIYYDLGQPANQEGEAKTFYDDLKKEIIKLEYAGDSMDLTRRQFNSIMHYVRKGFLTEEYLVAMLTYAEEDLAPTGVVTIQLMP